MLSSNVITCTRGKKLSLLFTSFFVMLLLVLPLGSELLAQCPMCRMSAGSNLAAGGTQAKGLNIGILMMLSTPYILVGGIGYFWWKNKKKS